MWGFKSWLARHLQKFSEIQTSPRDIALGFSIGTFLAVLPTFGFGIVVGGFLILVWKNISKVAMIAAFAFWNPFVLIPIYSFCYELGGIMFGSLPVEKYKFEMLNQIFTFSRRFLVANFFVALGLAVFFYIALYFGVPFWRKHRSK